MFSKKNIIYSSIFLLTLAILIIGILHITKPRIDTSSDERMRESTERLRDSLNDDQKAKFEQAVRYIAFDGLILVVIFEGRHWPSNDSWKLRVLY